MAHECIIFSTQILFYDLVIYLHMNVLIDTIYFVFMKLTISFELYDLFPPLHNARR